MSIALHVEAPLAALMGWPVIMAMLALRGAITVMIRGLLRPAAG